MPLLPPTVGERLAKCQTEVEVWGIVSGSNVDLLVNNAVVDTRNVTGSYAVFNLAAGLNANDVVNARQSLGTETSQKSPAVVAGDVDSPPPPPRLAPTIYRCAHCVYADAMAPGSIVTIFQENRQDGLEEVGRSTVNRMGFACFGPHTGFADSRPVRGRATTCGIDSPLSPRSALVAAPVLPAPNVHSPIFACQSSADMDGLTQGAIVEVFADAVSLGTFCTCWGAVHVNLPRQLTVGEHITAKQLMINPGVGCNIDGVLSGPPPGVPVIPPDSRIKPSIRPVLYDGDRALRVRNQIDGGEISLFARDNMGAPEIELGRVGSSQYEEIALNDPLRAGQIIRASQTLCGHTEFSDPLTVQPRPTVVPAPLVRPPLYDCGVLVPVDGVLTGAQVRVFQNGFLIGFAWADGPSVTVRVGPSLVLGRNITARQRVGGVDSLLSAPVTVTNIAMLPAPVILPPIRLGDVSVQVGGVVPGAFVEVFDGGNLAGTADTVETTVTVAINHSLDGNSRIEARQTLCGQTSGTSDPVSNPQPDPGQPGGHIPSTPADTPGTGFDVPPTADGPAIHVTIGGELTFPSDPGNPGTVDPNGAPFPLVVIAHGNHNPSSPSYQGYRYLANHLASLGMICMSINLNDINGRDDLIDARGLVILEHIRVLLARNTTPGDLLQNKIDANNIGIIGHSRGAEGVVDAQVQNFSRAPGSRFNIKGVVPIAPTNFLNRRHLGTSLFVIYGSADADVDGSFAGVNPFFIYDHAQTPKAMIFIHHARHNGFNEVWVRPGEENEAILPETISPAEHQAIAKAYISAFFQSVLFNRRDYDVYLRGPVRPRGLEGYSIHNQYQVTTRLVTDNFGDADPQLGLAVEMPIRREVNTLSQTAAYSRPGMTEWFDQEFRLVSQNPHDSRGSQLIWSASENYVTNLNNRDVRPFSVLSIRLGQQFSAMTTLNPADQPQDLLVTLVTTGGEATVRVGSITDLPFPHIRGGLTKAALKTVRIPIISFTAINPAVRLDQVTGVRFNFGITPTGAISVDDVEFSA